MGLRKTTYSGSGLASIFLLAAATAGLGLIASNLPTAPVTATSVDPFKTAHFTVDNHESKGDACVRHKAGFISNQAFATGIKDSLVFEQDTLQGIKDDCQQRYGALMMFNDLTKMTVTPAFDSHGRLNGKDTGFEYDFDSLAPPAPGR